MAAAVVEAAVDVTFTRLGSCAPQGCSDRQFDWQLESPLQLVTHSSFSSVQIKYGMVSEY